MVGSQTSATSADSRLKLLSRQMLNEPSMHDQQEEHEKHAGEVKADRLRRRMASHSPPLSCEKYGFGKQRYRIGA